MAYDEDLVDRVRLVLSEVPGVVEKRMFGSLCFLVRGNLCVAVSGRRGLMTRCDPSRYESLVAREHAAPFEIGGRGLTGWLLVDPEGLTRDEDLADWIDEALEHVVVLPTK